jgi:hypothetical protein
MPIRKNSKKKVLKKPVKLPPKSTKRISSEDVRKLMKEINSWTTKAKGVKEVKEAYSKDPSKVIKEKKIPIAFRGDLPAYGCYQKCSVLYKYLRDFGLRPKMTRYITSEGLPHTTILFKLNGIFFEADFIATKISPGGVRRFSTYGSLKTVNQLRFDMISLLENTGKLKYIKPGDYTYEMYKKERKTGKLAN